MKQYAAIDDTVYFWFAANTTSGSGGDGATPASDVRLAGATAGAAPVYSPTPSLLSHVNYPAGAYEIAITASVANGFVTGNTYAVFCTLAIDSQNPTGFVGSFDTKPVESNITQIGDAAQSATDLKDMVDTGYDTVNHKIQSDLIYIHGSALTETAGQLAAAFTKLFDVATPLLVASDVMRGTENAALAATALTDVTWTNAKAAFLDHSIATVDGNVDTILADTNELQTDWTNGGRLDLLIDRLIAANEIEATTVTGATSSTLFAATGLLDNTDNHYNDGVMVFTSGANRGQPKRILDFTGATKEITVSAAFETTPSIGDSFVITTQLAAAAAAGGDATATNQLAIIAALTAIKGTGWVQTSHSLAERPVGGTGGGGHCTWYDDDLDRANKFFKASPSKFKEILENLDSIKTKLSEVDSDSTIVDSISKNNSTMSEDLNIIRSSIAELSEGLKITDSLLISIADAASLEELLDEA